MLKGYLIKNINGIYLSNYFAWLSKDLVKPYVHSGESMDFVKEKLTSLREKEMNKKDPIFLPIEVIPVTWSKNEGIKIIGKSKFWTI